MPFDGTQLSDATQTLINGKKRIEKGWCQRVYSNENRVCMLAAIGGSYFNHQAALYLYEALRTPCLAAWNDEPGRTKEQVLTAFDRAIELSMQD